MTTTNATPKFEADVKHLKTGLLRITALRSLGYGVLPGDVGGWVSRESNLTHEGNCWISAWATVRDDARVSGDAHVEGNAVVSGYSRIYGSAKILDTANIHNSNVTGRVRVSGSAKLNNTELSGDGAASGSTVMSHVHTNLRFHNSIVDLSSYVTREYGAGSDYKVSLPQGSSNAHIENGYITNPNDLFIFRSAQFGELTVYRRNNTIGSAAVYRIGCTMVYSYGDLVSAARLAGLSATESRLLGKLEVFFKDLEVLWAERNASETVKPVAGSVESNDDDEDDEDDD